MSTSRIRFLGAVGLVASVGLMGSTAAATGPSSVSASEAWRGAISIRCIVIGPPSARTGEQRFSLSVVRSRNGARWRVISDRGRWVEREVGPPSPAFVRILVGREGNHLDHHRPDISREVGLENHQGDEGVCRASWPRNSVCAPEPWTCRHHDARNCLAVASGRRDPARPSGRGGTAASPSLWSPDSCPPFQGRDASRCCTPETGLKRTGLSIGFDR